jgi:hypothetical protein
MRSSGRVPVSKDRRPPNETDFMVVAPYNMQVRR